MIVGVIDLDFVLKKLDATPESELESLADESGVPKGTISKIKYRITKNPGVLTVDAIAKAYRARDAAAARAVKRRRQAQQVRVG